MDVSDAVVTVLPGTSRHAPSIVRFEDASPWVIEAGTRLIEGVPRLTHLTIKLADHAGEEEAISAVQLRELPLRHIVSATASLLHEEKQDEWAMRNLAQPKPRGQKSWPPDHYERVMAVYEWARKIGRPGGGRGAVAEFWQVTSKTVDLWLAHARSNRTDKPPVDPHTEREDAGEKIKIEEDQI